MRTLLWAVLAAPLLFLSACDATGPDAVPVDVVTAEAKPAATGADGLAAARSGTSHYHQVARAEADGWALASPCVESPAGGMGFHYLNFGLMDGALDPATPEALLYEPQKNGRLRLVAVEYIVPFGVVPPSGPAPVLFGETFHANTDLGFWALHAWVWHHNPAGMFADFNPRVTCDHA